MNPMLAKAAESVALFCRLNINAKKDLPVRSSEMGLLILMCTSDQAVTPAFAAEFFKVKKPMITAMVTNLHRLGYLERTPSAQDKRSFTLTPTEKAKGLVTETYAEYMKTMALIKKQLGEEDFETLVALLERSNAALLEEKGSETKLVEHKAREDKNNG